MALFQPTFALFDVGGMEMFFIFMIVMLLFGGKKLPEFAKGLGKSMREFKKAAAGVESEFKRAMDEEETKPAPYTPPPLPPLPDLPPTPSLMPPASDGSVPTDPDPFDIPTTPVTTIEEPKPEASAAPATTEVAASEAPPAPSAPAADSTAATTPEIKPPAPGANPPDAKV